MSLLLLSFFTTHLLILSFFFCLYKTTHLYFQFDPNFCSIFGIKFFFLWKIFQGLICLCDSVLTTKLGRWLNGRMKKSPLTPPLFFFYFHFYFTFFFITIQPKRTKKKSISKHLCNIFHIFMIDIHNILYIYIDVC